MTQDLSDSQSRSPSDLFPEALLEHHGKRVFAPMARWKSKKQIPPVLLITGQAGIGKKSMSRYLAEWILCETPPPGPIPKACKLCHSCLSFASGNHTAFTEVAPEDDTESLKIDQFRELKATVGFGTYHHHARVILIPQVERMTPQAANSMLKLLEETPPGWQFLLTTHDSTLLLPTLVSRCQMIRLKPLPTLEIQQLLHKIGVAPARATVCAELSQGSWDRALRFADDDIWEKRSEVLKFIETPHLHCSPLIDWATQKISHFETLVDLLEQITAELLAWSSSTPLVPPEEFPWKCASTHPTLTSLAHHYQKKPARLESARHFWFQQAERLGQSRHEIHLPLNRKILAQDLLFPWIGAPT